MEVFWGQLNEPVWLVSSERFLEAAKHALGRELFPHEVEDRQALIEEFAALVPEAKIEELRARINISRNVPATTPLKQTA